MNTPASDGASARGLLRALIALMVLACLGAAPAAWLAQETEDLRRNPVQPQFLDLGPRLHVAPGSDLCLGMSWEPTIAVDPADQDVVAVSQGRTLQVSFDGGVTFTQTIDAPIPAGWARGGDPSLAFDHQGRLFWTYLGTPPTPPGREVFITGYQRSGDSFVQIPAVTWPVSVTASAGLGVPNNADKEWIAADADPTSPFAGNLYVVWSDIDQFPLQIQVSTSIDGGQTWQAAQQLSVAADGQRPWPSHVAVGPGGDAYVAYHSQPGFLDPGFRVPDGVSGFIALYHSNDGGGSWQSRTPPYGPGEADMTWNVQHLANGVIPGATFWLQGSSQPWILPDPFMAGRLWVVANDDPDNDVDVGDAADVFIVRSDDFGQTWTAPLRVDSGPAGTFQIMPTAAIDPKTGAIAVMWYDNRALSDVDGDGNFELDLLVTYSYDGGLTFLPEVKVNDGLFDPQASTSCRFCCGAMPTCTPPTIRIGEYNGIAFGNCTTYMVWADDNPCTASASGLNTFFDRDPEGGGDLTPPTIFCPPNVAVGCNDPTDPSSTGMATALDSCDPDPRIVFVDIEVPGDCPPGTVLMNIRRIWSATDSAGNISSCEQFITVVDFDPPVIGVPDPIVLECNSPGGVSSDDPAIQAWIALASAIDECSDTELTVGMPALFPAGCGEGETTQVIFTGIDACGNSDFGVSTVTVVDTTPPALDCSVQVTSLWPPDHRWVDVGLSIEASDLCDPDGVSIEIAVTSDEHPAEALGSGGPLHCPDAILTPDGRVLLRAERSGTGDGRVYHIVVTATDSCQNQTVCDVVVTVPMRPGLQAVDSGGAFDATDCAD